MLDPATGVISGTPTWAGSYSFEVTAANAVGSASATVQMQVGLVPLGSIPEVTPTVVKYWLSEPGLVPAEGQGEFSFEVTDANGQVVSRGQATIDENAVQGGAPGEAIASADMQPIAMGLADIAAAMTVGWGDPALGQEPDALYGHAAFTYELREVDDGKLGVTYDPAVISMRVEVTVNPDGSVEQPTVTYIWPDGFQTDLGCSFRNSYAATEPATLVPVGQVETSCQQLTDLSALRYSYEVLDAGGNVVAGGSSACDGAIDFGSIELPAAEGTYSYTVRQLDAGTPGLQIDTTTYTLWASVADDGAGSWVVTDWGYVNDATGEACASPYFQNTYDGGVTSLALSSTVSLDGRALEAGEFSFTIYDYTGDVVGAPVARGTNDASGTVRFGSLNYSYNVVEGTDGQEGETGEPETDDAASSDDPATDGGAAADGESAGADASSSGDDPAGSDEAADAGDPAGTGESAGAGGVEGTNEPAAPDGSQGAGDVGGAESPDAGTAGAVEVEDGAPGFEDGAVPDTDAGAPAPETGEAPAEGIASTGEASAGGGIEGSEGAGDTGFATAESEDAPNPVAQVLDLFAPEVAVADDADVELYVLEPLVATGRVVSTDLGLHRYLLCQDAGQLGGVNYDQARYIIDVEVADDVANGSIRASVVGVTRVNPDGSQQTLPVEGATGLGHVAFANTYRITGASYVRLEGTSTLAGRDAAANELSFEVLDASGNVVATGLNAAAPDGQAAPIEFTAIEISAPGSYTYAVRQTRAGQTVGGVANSMQEFTVRIDAADNGQGGLTCTVVYPEGGIAFASTYSLQGATVQVVFEGTKTLTGRDMASGEFGFAISDAQGTVVSEGRNAAAADGQPGRIEFEALTLSAPGEYDFAIAENAGDAEGVTYDGRTFAAHVSVVDNLDGTMSAQVSYPDGTPAFANAYTKAEVPGGDDSGGTGGSGTTGGSSGTGGSAGAGGADTPEVPKTGDATSMAAAACLAGAGAALLAGAGALAVRRRARG